MLPIEEAPVAYRAILVAERKGELQVYRVGHASRVDEAELSEWIRRTGIRKVETENAVAALIEFNHRRRL